MPRPFSNLTGNGCRRLRKLLHACAFAFQMNTSYLLNVKCFMWGHIHCSLWAGDKNLFEASDSSPSPFYNCVLKKLTFRPSLYFIRINAPCRRARTTFLIWRCNFWVACSQKRRVFVPWPILRWTPTSGHVASIQNKTLFFLGFCAEMLWNKAEWCLNCFWFDLVSEPQLVYCH